MNHGNTTKNRNVCFAPGCSRALQVLRFTFSESYPKGEINKAAIFLAASKALYLLSMYKNFLQEKNQQGQR